MRHLVLILAAMAFGCGPRTAAPWYADVDTTPPNRRHIEAGGSYLDRFAAEELRPPLAPRVAYELLAATPDFRGTAVGYAGLASMQSYAFNALLDRADAAAVFESLVHRATLPGQLYGLCGLYFSDRDRFLALVPRYRDMDGTVPALLYGCVGGEVRVSAIVADIESGNWPRRFVAAGPGEE